MGVKKRVPLKDFLKRGVLPSPGITDLSRKRWCGRGCVSSQLSWVDLRGPRFLALSGYHPAGQTMPRLVWGPRTVPSPRGIAATQGPGSVTSGGAHLQGRAELLDSPARFPGACSGSSGAAGASAGVTARALPEDAGPETCRPSAASAPASTPRLRGTGSPREQCTKLGCWETLLSLRPGILQQPRKRPAPWGARSGPAR